MPGTRRVGLRSRTRERRSHAERSAETRSRIIAAVRESVAEVGFQRTTATEIARRADVTWGAAQHHFGGKGGILNAVLEDSFGRFAARLDDLPGDTPLAERASLFVDRAWAHFGSSEFRSTFEILLNDLGREESGAPSWQEDMFAAWDRVWMRWFHDAPISRRKQLRIERYAISVLSGLASSQMLEGAGAAGGPPELAWLVDTLTRELSCAD